MGDSEETNEETNAEQPAAPVLETRDAAGAHALATIQVLGDGANWSMTRAIADKEPATCWGYELANGPISLLWPPGGYEYILACPEAKLGISGADPRILVGMLREACLHNRDLMTAAGTVLQRLERTSACRARRAEKAILKFPGLKNGGKKR